VPAVPVLAHPRATTPHREQRIVPWRIGVAVLFAAAGALIGAHPENGHYYVGTPDLVTGLLAGFIVYLLVAAGVGGLTYRFSRHRASRPTFIDCCLQLSTLGAAFGLVFLGALGEYGQHAQTQTGTPAGDYLAWAADVKSVSDSAAPLAPIEKRFLTELSAGETVMARQDAAAIHLGLVRLAARASTEIPSPDAQLAALTSEFVSACNLLAAAYQDYVAGLDQGSKALLSAGDAKWNRGSALLRDEDARTSKLATKLGY
jgi:hypothetical protein